MALPLWRGQPDGDPDEKLADSSIGTPSPRKESLANPTDRR